MKTSERRVLPPQSEVRRIACLMINGIGDIVCVTPAIEAIKRRYPEAELTVIVRPHLRSLLVGNPFVERVLDYGVGSPWRRLAYLFDLRRQRFDFWIDLHMPTYNTVSSNARDFRRNALLAAASGARFRLAYAHPALARVLTHPVPVPHADQLRTQNIVDTTVALVDPSAVGKFHKHVPVTAVDRGWAAQQLPRIDRPRIALYFGSRQAADLWPDEHVFELIERLAESRPQAELIIVGGEHEAALARRLTNLAAGKTAILHSFIGRTSFGQTAALLERCNAYIGTDSGATHIADAVGLPIVALFSSKNYPQIWAPITKPVFVLNRPVPCGPCLQAHCHRGNECMRLISPQSVIDALERLLAEPALSNSRPVS